MPNMLRVYRRTVALSILAVGVCVWVCRSNQTQAGDLLLPQGKNAFQQVTGEELDSDRQGWDSFYNQPGYRYGKDPALFLLQNARWLPLSTRRAPLKALDIAMGEGRNAVYLALRGYQVVGVDYSSVALRKAKRLARDHHVSIETINADLNRYVIESEKYDVILNIDFLLRPLLPAIKKGLKPGGIVVFETALGSSSDTASAMRQGELAQTFSGFKILLSRERQGKASLIAQKPISRP